MEIVSLTFVSIAVAANVGLLILSSIVFFSLLGVLNKLKSLHQKIQDEYQLKIEEANLKALEILKKAEEKTIKSFGDIKLNKQQINDDIKAQTQDLIKTFNQETSQTLSTIKVDYEQFLTSIKDQLKADTSTIAGDLVKKASGEIDEFVKELEKGTIDAQVKFDTQLKDEFTKAMHYVDEYRKEQQQLVEKSINQIILSVSAKVLAETISITDHERLIFDSLEQAKKENILSGSIFK